MRRWSPGSTRNLGAANEDALNLREDDITYERGQPRLFSPTTLRRNRRRGRDRTVASNLGTAHKQSSCAVPLQVCLLLNSGWSSARNSGPERDRNRAW